MNIAKTWRLPDGTGRNTSHTTWIYNVKWIKYCFRTTDKRWPSRFESA